MKDLTLRYLAGCLIITLATYIGLNGLFFLLFFGGTLAPLTLPYTEDFDHLARLDYRQFGGNWALRDGRLVQTIDNDTDLMAVIPAALETGEAYRFQTRIAFLSGNQGGGIMFNLQHANNRRSSQMIRFGADQGQAYLVYGYFDEAQNFVSQGSLTPFDLSGAANGIDLGVAVHDGVYDVLVNDAVVAPNIPLIYEGGTLALTTWFSGIAFDNVRIEGAKTAPAVLVTPAATAVDMPVSQPVDTASGSFSEAFKDGDDHSRWQPFGGKWSFEPGALAQTETDGYDYGITYLETFHKFTLRAQFTHRQNSGGGVLFNMSHADSVRGAHMVRYFENNRLVWGYFDDSGAFQGQGDTAVTAPGTDTHQLEISVDGATYSIKLDDHDIAANIPLVSQQGYIGLTASQSAVAFEQVTVDDGDVQPDVLSPVQPSGPGDWSSDSGTTIQHATDSADYYSAMGIHGETFNVSVDIILPDVASPQPTRAGLIFHAPDAATPAGGYTVRLLWDGQIVWGTLDAQNQFQQQGSTPVTLNAGTHTLSLHVHAHDYDIVLDGIPAASALPLSAHEGWLFFSTLGGPVTFSNFTLNLTEIGS